MNNLSPREIVLYASGTLSLILFGLLVLIKVFFSKMLSWALILGIPITSFGIAYFLFRYFVEKFIYRKIKLIYKNIHSLKTAGELKPGSIDVDTDIISEIEQEVQQWTSDKTREIEDLKQMATYRKEFLGDVMHELKTPIFNIQGYVHSLIDGGLQDDKVNKGFLYKASNNIDRINSIIDDLDTITRIETSSLVLEFTTFNITDLIKEIFEEMEMRADIKDIKLILREASPDILVNADRDKVSQVLTNLIANSIRYGKENGKTIVGVDDMDENVWIEVKDDSIGIEAKHLPRLFERFYRVDKSRSREQGGTGLGLSIVKHILEAHGQTVNVRSAVGVGTTFGFSLKKS